MMKVPRTLMLSLWMACLALRLCLPAWDVCWHRDGRVCDEVVPRSCCGSDIPASDHADDDCSDCTDLQFEKSTGAVRGTAESLMASEPSVIVGSSVVTAASDLATSSVGSNARGVSPPSPPGSFQSVPLRC